LFSAFSVTIEFMTTFSQLLNQGFDPKADTVAVQFDDFTEAGATCADFEKHPDEFKTPEGQARLKHAAELIHAADHGDAADFNTPEWTRFYIGRFAVSHSPDDLNEIIRRARHFDGSTATIQVQTNAVALLAKGVHDFPQSVGRGLKAAGYNFGNIKPGSFPPKSRPVAPVVSDPEPAPKVTSDPISLGVGVGVGGLIEGMMGTGNQAAAPIPASAAEPEEDSGALLRRPFAMLAANMVTIPDGVHGVIDVCGVPMTITVALELELEIVKATRALLLPAEGFAWRDDTMSPSVHSQLFDDAGRLCGMVLQDRFTAKYSAFLGDVTQPSAGLVKLFTEFDDDMNYAKFAVASKIREQSKG
jgi:hypothetical protein